MKSSVRNLLIVCVASFWLSLSFHAAQDNNRHLSGYDNQQTVLVMHQAPYVSEHIAGQQPYTDELWLIGSLLVSLTGLFIVVRYLHH